MELRLGAIYALERIARDSERDHWSVMEVLTAYVRQNAPRGTDEDVAPIQPRPSVDIQAVLDVVGRRSRTFETEEEQALDLSNTDLRGADLLGAHLERADLSGTNLEGGYLGGMRLQLGGRMRRPVEDSRAAYLQGAFLMGANLKGVYLIGVDLEGADFAGANLENTYLGNANLGGADLRSARNWRAQQLQAAYWNEKTIWPVGFTAPCRRNLPDDLCGESNR